MIKTAFFVFLILIFGGVNAYAADKLRFFRPLWYSTNPDAKMHEDQCADYFMNYAEHIQKDPGDENFPYYLCEAEALAQLGKPIENPLDRCEMLAAISQKLDLKSFRNSLAQRFEKKLIADEAFTTEIVGDCLALVMLKPNWIYSFEVLAYGDWNDDDLPDFLTLFHDKAIRNEYGGGTYNIIEALVVLSAGENTYEGWPYCRFAKLPETIKNTFCRP